MHPCSTITTMIHNIISTLNDNATDTLTFSMRESHISVLASCTAHSGPPVAGYRQNSNSETIHGLRKAKCRRSTYSKEKNNNLTQKLNISIQQKLTNVMISTNFYQVPILCANKCSLTQDFSRHFQVFQISGHPTFSQQPLPALTTQ